VDGETGWLRPPEPAAFADVLLDAASAGDRLEPMREAARRRADEFTWDRMVARLDEVMAAVAEGVSPADAP
jgi:glycosyltransferase involved in cell wall biosynthesis